ncbi:hypothetical protein JVU11DRAFT_687 [Chiua virens]|nr:hypothetical protein JVU11DRAFT_687 [Chiua virens]
MSRTGPKRSESATLLLKLNTRSLVTSPPQLRQPLAYVLHLRSYWKPEGRAKLTVPASWMGFLALADSESGVKCAVDRCCPFRGVRFENVAETCRAVSDDELELPRDVVSHVLTNGGRDDDCLSTSVFRAFEGIPRTRLQSDASEKPFSSSTSSTSVSRCISFALIPRHGSSSTGTPFAENDMPCLLLGMNTHPQTRHHDPHSTSCDTRSRPLTLTSIPEELTRHGQLHLARLASLMHREAIQATTESFPEWLILFGLVFDAHRVCIVVYVPYRRHLDAVDCAAYVVDELTVHAPVTNTSACEPILERLRLLSALTTLRRHVRHLSKYLLTTIGPCDGVIGRPNPPASSRCDQHDTGDSGSLDRRATASLGSSQDDRSSMYSTCPSSVHSCGSHNAHVEESKELCSSCRSATSCCSTCSSLLASDSIYYSEDTRYTNSNYMEPSTSSVSQTKDDCIAYPRKLTKTKKREIIAWALGVVPSEHPVMDNYRMAVYDPSPGQHKVIDFNASTCK